MKAVEFKSQLENGKIAVPMESGLAEGQAVRVLVLVEDHAPNQPVQTADKRAFWQRTEGAWHGELVREAQGDYPTRLEME